MFEKTSNKKKKKEELKDNKEEESKKQQRRGEADIQRQRITTTTKLDPGVKKDRVPALFSWTCGSQKFVRGRRKISAGQTAGEVMWQTAMKIIKSLDDQQSPITPTVRELRRE